MTDTAAVRSTALLTDLYELTMAGAYLRAGIDARATFSLTIRRLPPQRRYLIAAGLDAALAYLESLHFSAEDIAGLRATGLLPDHLLVVLANLRFTGDVRAVPEGTVIFAEEPLVEVTAPLIEAQIIETYLINILHLHTVIASKAARVVDAAAGRAVVDFGLRRAHGADAGMAAARATYLAGCVATSNVAAGLQYGIPITGTMAHSFIMSFEREVDAFRAYAAAYPDDTTLLIDTYDTVEGARHAVTVARELRRAGHRLRAVRIDSGDVGALAVPVRAVLDEEGFPDVQIFVSGGLDEYAVAALVDRGAPIDGFGVGTRMDAAEDAPTLEAAYKLVEFDGRPVMKLSAGKASLPGRRQVWRCRDADGRFTGDVIAGAQERPVPGARPLLVEVMRCGRRIHVPESLDTMRARCAAERAALPPATRAVIGEAGAPYPVTLSTALETLRSRVSAAPH